jgi:NAD(P)-dependent dehydrogenase (short-subunit alcohol dehydrogenase family)
MTKLQELFRCDRPVALVTGSGSPRVGRAIAEHLADLGCRLALHANDSDDDAANTASRLKQAYGCEAIVTSGDFEDDQTADRIVAETCDHFGRIDILVNAAAIWSPTRLEDVTADELRRYDQINLAGTFLCSRAAGLRMVAQPTGGSIVNLGDWATGRPYLDHAAYFPSKGGVETVTRSLAVELAHRNPRIRVNCIRPGPVLLGDDVPAEQRERIASATLVGHVGHPRNVAHAVQFLCENDFVTGVCLPVDGGRSIYAPDGLQIGLNTG